MANISLADRITNAEKDIQRNKNKLAELKKAAEVDDGRLTEEDEEYKEWDTINRANEELERVTQDVRNQYEANKAKWGGMASDVTALSGDMATLTDWGTTGLEGLTQKISEMDINAADFNFRDAIACYETAKTSITPLMKEYEKQSAAKVDYDRELGEIEQRVTDLRAEEVSNEVTTSGLNQIDTNLVSTATVAETLDYVEALSLLRMGAPEVARIEDEIVTLKTDLATAEYDLAALQDRIDDMEPRVSAFEELTDRFAQVKSDGNDANNMIANGKYADAISTTASADYECDAITSEFDRLEAELEAEQLRIAAEREAWERLSVRWSEFQNQVAELAEWKDPAAAQAQTMQTSIEAQVKEEKFADASSLFEDAEASISAAWSKHQEQVAAKTTYDDFAPKLDQRFQTASGSEFLDDTTTGPIQSTEAAFQIMHNAAEANDFITANEQNQPISEALDLLEQTIRENEIRAELGDEGDSSDPDIENEVARRLYEEERTAVEEKVAAARRIDVNGSEITGALDQIETDLVSIEGTASGGDFDAAKEQIRVANTEIGRIDEMIRDQLEIKARYDKAFGDMSAHANSLITCEMKVISDETQKIIDSSQEADVLAQAGDYEGAIALVEGWEKDLDALDKRDAELHALKTEAEVAYNRLSSRITAARDNPHEIIQPAADGVVKKADDIEALLAKDEYGGAIPLIDELVVMLDEYESEAEAADWYARYEKAVSDFDLQAGLMDMRSCVYPEAKPAMEAVEANVKERDGFAAAADWQGAVNSVTTESGLLRAFKTQVATIDSAKASYDEGSPAALELTTSIFPEGNDDTGIVATQQKILGDIVALMESAAADSRYIEAKEKLDELKKAIEAAKLAIRDLFQASDSTINKFIKDQVVDAKTAVMGGLLTAINAFSNQITVRITSERGVQKAARYSGYALDASSVWVSLIPGGGDIAAAIMGNTKTAIDIAATELDDYRDAGDTAYADTLVNKLHAQRKAMDSKWNSDIGESFVKAKKPDVYKDIGRCLYGSSSEADPSGAEALVRGLGLPEKSMSAFYDAYLSKLLSDFEKERGKFS